jgi:hypothetical protein
VPAGTPVDDENDVEGFTRGGSTPTPLGRSNRNPRAT